MAPVPPAAFHAAAAAATATATAFTDAAAAATAAAVAALAAVGPNATADDVTAATAAAADFKAASAAAAAAATAAATSSAATTAAAVTTDTFNSNSYATKKSYIQGFLSTSVISSNIPTLIDLYRRKNLDENITFFTPAVLFLCFSIVIEFTNLIIALILACMLNIDKNESNQRWSNGFSNGQLVLSTLSMLINVVIGGLGITQITTDDPPVGNSTTF
jgi:Ninjurin